MKRLCAVCALGLVATGVCEAGEKVAFAPHPEPMPVSMTVETNTAIRLDRDMTLAIQCQVDGDAAVEWAEDHLKLWFKATKQGWFSSVNMPNVIGEPFAGSRVSGGAEGYELEAKPSIVRIRANTLQGVRYALYTLRQTTMAEPRTGRTVGWYVMPAMKVVDAPALAFRGIHIPWNLRSTAHEIEKRVRVAAYLKYNYAVIEPWGAYHSKVLPWWGWKEGTMTQSAVKHIVEVAKDVGITLIPQIPAFGHASMGITSPGKHAILDAHPEYQPLFDSLNSWNWCLSNPETLKVQFELIDEMMELFDYPKYFHVGCDEAAKPNCPECLASDYRQLVIKHILALHDGLKARGAQMMLWHDMFLLDGDKRWEGFYANGTEETVKAFESFPRDIIVCDWFYGKAPKDKKYPTLEHFKKMGFPVLTCPWYETDGTELQCQRAAELGLMGVLQTTWGQGSGKAVGQYLAKMFAHGACAAWGTPYRESPLWKWHYDLDYIHTVRHAVWDMGLEDFVDTGTYTDHVPAE